MRNPVYTMETTLSSKSLSLNRVLSNLEVYIRISFIWLTSLNGKSKYTSPSSTASLRTSSANLDCSREGESPKGSEISPDSLKY